MKIAVGDAVIEVQPLSEERVDVFTGTGWYNWTRFEVRRIKGRVFLNKINGKPIKDEEFKAVCHAL